MIRILKSSSSSSEQKGEVLQFITNKKYNRSVRDTFTLFFRMEDAKYCTDQFWSAIDSEPLDLVGIRHCSRILPWFPLGSHENPSEEDNINRRTIDAVTTWISMKKRHAHDFCNGYLFESFYRTIPNYSWWTAWEEDLLIEDPSKRRYFLPDLWSSENIIELRNVYSSISKNKVEELYRLITKGPTIATLKDLKLNSNRFILQTIDDQTESSELLPGALKQARRRQEITTLTELQTLLEHYVLLAKQNRQRAARDIEIWPMKIAPCALINVDEHTLNGLLQLIKDNILFYRDFILPIIPFLKLYIISNASNENNLCSLIVAIAFSSTYILTAPPGEKKIIRVFENDKFEDISLSENRWNKLIEAFKCARDTYGCSCFFKQ
jgi:hypothetical protein